MFALVDCNNFFVSCEQVFNPKLLKRPVVVLSSNDGCVIARSKEAKALNIAMGAPYFQYKNLFLQRGVATLSSNPSLYKDMSSRVMQTLKTFNLPLEIYSIDEAFFSLLEHEKMFLKDWGLNVLETVFRWTGISTSIGIAPTKTLAKLASSLAKKSAEGIFVIRNPEPFLKKFPVEEIWGIGARSKKTLFRCGIHTAKQLIEKPDPWIQKNLSRSGLRTVLELRGQPCLECHEILAPRLSIRVSRSFKSELSTLEEVKEAMAAFIAEAAKKLRKQQLKASYLIVFIQTNRFKKPFFSESAATFLPLPTAYTPDLINKAHRCLKNLFRPNLLYKKVGIVLSDLADEKKCQYDLFETDIFREKKERAIAAFDNVNKKYKCPLLFFAAEGMEKQWKGSPKNRSPQYTTAWNELLKIKVSTGVSIEK